MISTFITLNNTKLNLSTINNIEYYYLLITEVFKIKLSRYLSKRFVSNEILNIENIIIINNGIVRLSSDEANPRISNAILNNNNLYVGIAIEECIEFLFFSKAFELSECNVINLDFIIFNDNVILVTLNWGEKNK